jgi:hypothetical protein
MLCPNFLSIFQPFQYVIKTIPENQKGFELSGIYQLVDDCDGFSD